MKFMRKLFEVEAVQWTGENERSLHVNARGGPTLVSVGNWVARENGRLHVFSDKEFREMFDGQAEESPREAES